MAASHQLRMIRESGLFEIGKTDNAIDGQSFVKWKLKSVWQRVFHPRRLRQRTLCLQPLGELRITAESSGEYIIEILPPLVLNDLKCEKRIHERTNRVQWLVTDLLMHLKTLRPLRALCVVGITVEDLYPSDEWNFVLGHAMCTTGCAVISVGRYASDNPREEVMIMKLKNMIWRLARVVTHETCHLLGMGHCYGYVCAMNQSTTVLEAESQPLVLCPLCLRKLQHVLRFQYLERYCSLKAVCYQLSQADGDACITSEAVNSTADVQVVELRVTQTVASVHKNSNTMDTSFSDGNFFEVTCEWLNAVIGKLTRDEDM
ncbi:archaemetzincin-2-like isoform X2 [Corticium candelabrum]|uniref:archaemetzincin-2-like isoform X2 n=1 Tax=Corticium candelabrum TaxID=121492 RepID=UPI002E25D986|nr:archaemetzincin-2-like isoform X2 [Corticium candelabrum]